MTNPFTLRVFDLVTTWSGKLKRKCIFEKSFATPEAMLTERSKWEGRGYSIVTYEPDVWEDPRPSRDISFKLNDSRTNDGMPF